VTLLHNRALLLLIVGQTVSTMADWSLRVALLIWVYALTRSGIAVSLVGLCEAVPILVLSPLAGVFVDRWSRAHTMAGAVLARVFLLLPLLAVHDRAGVPLLLVVTCLANAASQFFLPASSAALPMVVAPEEIGPANSLVQLVSSIVPVVAPVLAAGIYGTLGPHALVVSMIALYGVSLPFLALVPAGKPIVATAARTSVLAEMLDGVRYLGRTSPLVTLAATAVIATLGWGGLSVMDVIFVTHALHLGTAMAGVLMASYGAGNLVGGAVMWLAISRVRRHYHVLLWSGGVAIGLALLAYAIMPNLALATTVLFLAGVVWPPVLISWLTLIQLATEEAFMGRVMSLTRMTSSVSMIISLSGAGALADAVGVRQTIALGATFLLLTGLFDLAFVRATPESCAIPVEQAQNLAPAPVLVNGPSVSVSASD
jgi:DHA3 family macrolide efflux protein-like MFS transporter